MTPPALTRLLMLEAPAPQADGAGGQSYGWRALGLHWAEVTPRRGAERLTLDALRAAEVTHRLRIRWRAYGAPSRPTPAQRFRDGDRAYVIAAVTEADPHSQWLLIWAREEALR